MYAATGGPNVKWGEHRFQIGGPSTTGPPLATTMASLNVRCSCFILKIC